jgi:Glycerate kinase family
MHVVIAPDSFKRSLSALGVAEAMERGVRSVFPEAEVLKVPIADGGEGTVEALVATTGGQTLHTAVRGPLGEIVNAHWGVLRDGRTAVIEMAAASGLPLVPPGRRDPRVTTTFGTGDLMKAALDAGPPGSGGEHRPRGDRLRVSRSGRKLHPDRREPDGFSDSHGEGAGRGGSCREAGRSPGRLSLWRPRERSGEGPLGRDRRARERRPGADGGRGVHGGRRGARCKAARRTWPSKGAPTQQMTPRRPNPPSARRFWVDTASLVAFDVARRSAPRSLSAPRKRQAQYATDFGFTALSARRRPVSAARPKREPRA